ncbi:MAG: autotransporter outer membrane beta-barrel domain-containing protein [Bdellovibrionales bacterium]|nr:autotransporter outer membrane beta-barrel domain-containing protein [Bdellovibrionales bacterium]
MRIITLFVLLFAFGVSEAQQIVFAPAFSYFKDETTNKNNAADDSESKRTMFDIKLAYLHYSGLYLGGIYTTGKIGDDKTSGVGPTLGYSHYSGFYALFSYYLMSKYEVDPNTSGLTYRELSDGMGAQVDIGWVFPLTSTFSIGPQISYRSINYKKAEDGAGLEFDSDITKSSISPYVSLWFQF